MTQAHSNSFNYLLLIIYPLLQEQRNNITDMSTIEGTTISTDRMSNRTHSNTTEMALTNKTEIIITNNETETTSAKTESEIILLNNTDSETSNTETVMESILHATPTTTEKILMPVTQDSDATQWNESHVQTGQQNFVLNAQKTQKNKYNMSSTHKFNMTGPQDGRIISEDRVEKMESEQLQNLSVPTYSYQRIHKNSNSDLDQGDNISETNSLSDTLLPLSESKDGTVPIRIILHHPHEHQYKNGGVTGYEYVVLQTGNPAYHGHLEETVIPEEEALCKNEKGLDTADTDKETSPRKHKGRTKHGKAKASTSGETTENSESTEEKSAEKTSHHHHKGWKKEKSGETKDSYDIGSSTEISQDIRKHGNHQNSTKPSDNNTIHFQTDKGRYFHKPGHHKKHKFIHIVVGDNTNGTGSEEGTSSVKGHKQPHVSAAQGRNETNDGIITKSNNKDNSSTETIKVEIHKNKPTSKKGRYEHHRTSVMGKLNANQYPNTNIQNVSSAQQPLLPLSTVQHRAHRPTCKHGRDDEPSETDSHEQQPVTFRPKQADTPNMEDLPMSSIMTNTSTDINTDGEEQRIQYPSVHNEESVKVDDPTTPNVGNTTDTPTSSSREDSSDSERQEEDIIKHYSKLLKWIDYPL
jgi:hypothetical protein